MKLKAQDRNLERCLQAYTFFTIETPGYLKVNRKRIDLHEAENFRKEMIKYLTFYKKDIILDLSILDDLDCAGIAVIVRAEAAARKEGVHIKIKGLHGRAENSARITRLDKILSSQEYQVNFSHHPR